VVNIAHLPPILIEGGPAGGARVMDTGEPVPPLGLHPEPVVASGTWSPGSRLLLYTDGTTESRDRDGTFFELSSATSLLVGGSLEDALDRLIGALTAHVGHALTDDVALVLAEHLPASTLPSGGHAP
jgi:serine phosphatase RsbU (regulator of sigma subunit)